MDWFSFSTAPSASKQFHTLSEGSVCGLVVGSSVADVVENSVGLGDTEGSDITDEGPEELCTERITEEGEISAAVV